jgi:hypothetical protein
MVAKSACIWRPGSVSNRISGSGLAHWLQRREVILTMLTPPE